MQWLLQRVLRPARTLLAKYKGLNATWLYFLKQLNRSSVAPRELTQFYITCVRSILECARPVLHRALPSYPSEALERLQKRAMRIIYPALSYNDALELTGLLDEICAYPAHVRCPQITPWYMYIHISTKKPEFFIAPRSKTERCKKRFIISHLYSS